jgi:hypothetical protein
MFIKEKKRLGFPTRGPSGSEERRRREEGPAFIRVHLRLICLFFLRVLCDLCGEHLSFVAAYHANYG